MKKLIFFIYLAVISVTLNSCKITQEDLWGGRIDDDEVVSDLLINKGGDKVILMGKKYNYFVNDDERMIKNLALWNGKENLRVGIAVFARGSVVEKIKVSFWATIKDLSKGEFDFMKSNGGKEFDKNYDNNKYQKISMPRLSLKGYRVSVKEGVVSNEDGKYVSTGLIGLDHKVSIFEEDTPSRTTVKVLLTPFAIVADILMTPIYLIGTIGMIAAE